jgi:uncharacterized protein (TIGR02145 family)
MLLLLVAHSARGTSLSGSVTDLLGHPLAGAKVMLSLLGEATSADVAGAWSFAPATTGMNLGTLQEHALTSHLVLNAGTIRMDFSGNNVSGQKSQVRRASVTSIAAVGNPVMAARNMVVVSDTLVVSWKGRVRLRVPVSSLSAGAMGALAVDSATSAGDIPWNEAVTYGELVDARDGQVYRTVTLGTKVWMAENLNFKVGSSWWQNNSSDSGAKYGRLYNWAGAMGLDDSCISKSCTLQVKNVHQGACPKDWHVSTDAEWTWLSDTLMNGMNTGIVLKSKKGWDTTGGNYDANGKDSLGLRVLPAGVYQNSYFMLTGKNAEIWTATELRLYQNNAFDRGFHVGYGSMGMSRTNTSEQYAYSVRCIKN